MKEKGKVQKMLAPDLKRNTKWGFLARSNVNEYYFKKVLPLTAWCLWRKTHKGFIYPLCCHDSFLPKRRGSLEILGRRHLMSHCISL